MSTNGSSDSKPALDDAVKEARDLLLKRVQEIRVKISDGMKEKPRMSYPVRTQLSNQVNELLSQYFEQLPHYVFGRCPICNVPLENVFDPWGLDGFWWQERSSGRCPKPSACEHFRVLTGALNLNEKPPHGGEKESYPGPEVPYIIPKVLELPTMIAVISSIPMKNGYMAYPTSYFSLEKPLTLELANPWTKTSCGYTHPDGRPVFAIMTDPWDFELKPWIEGGRIQWIEANDPKNILKSAPSNQCPYVNLKGLRLQQIIQKDKRITKPPPNNEEMDPFSG